MPQQGAEEENGRQSATRDYLSILPKAADRGLAGPSRFGLFETRVVPLCVATLQPRERTVANTMDDGGFSASSEPRNGVRLRARRMMVEHRPSSLAIRCPPRRIEGSSPLPSALRSRTILEVVAAFRISRWKTRAHGISCETVRAVSVRNLTGRSPHSAAAWPSSMPFLRIRSFNSVACGFFLPSVLLKRSARPA